MEAGIFILSLPTKLSEYDRIESTVSLIMAKEFCRIFRDESILLPIEAVQECLNMIKKGERVYRLIDTVLLLFAYKSKMIEWNEQTLMPKVEDSRHVARCRFRRDKECTLLDQPCFSSQACAFYKIRKESKIERYKTTFLNDDDKRTAW